MKKLKITSGMLRTLIGTMILCVFILAISSCKYENTWPCDESGIKILKVVQTGTNNPVEGAEVILYKYFDNHAMYPTPYQSLYTDSEGMIYWPCTEGVTDICARREDYWETCPPSLSLTYLELADDILEMRPKAWIRFFVVNDPNWNESAYVQVANSYRQIESYHAATDSGYYAYVDVTGGINNTLYVYKYASGNALTGIDEVIVQAGLFDTTDFVYRY